MALFHTEQGLDMDQVRKDAEQCWEDDQPWVEINDLSQVRVAFNFPGEDIISSLELGGQYWIVGAGHPNDLGSCVTSITRTLKDMVTEPKSPLSLLAAVDGVSKKEWKGLVKSLRDQDYGWYEVGGLKLNLNRGSAGLLRSLYLEFPHGTVGIFVDKNLSNLKWKTLRDRIRDLVAVQAGLMSIEWKR